MFPRSALFAVALALALVAPSASNAFGQRPSPSGQRLLVSAAISLTDALADVERAFRRAGGPEVRFNFAGSNVLARQIVNGAPADLFISADEAQMALAASRGAVETPVPLLGNRLAIVTTRGKGTSIPDVTALTRVRRIAVGDPTAVPAGVYARDYLRRIGLWTAIEPRLLTLANVRAALHAVEAGGADVAIVYESDAAASRTVDLAVLIDGADAPRIVYPAALVRASKNRAAAQRFLEYLQGPEASEIFRRFKFQPLPHRTYGPKDPGTHEPTGPGTHEPTDPGTQ